MTNRWRFCHTNNQKSICRYCQKASQLYDWRYSWHYEEFYYLDENKDTYLYQVTKYTSRRWWQKYKYPWLPSGVAASLNSQPQSTKRSRTALYSPNQIFVQRSFVTSHLHEISHDRELFKAPDSATWRLHGGDVTARWYDTRFLVSVH